MCVFAALVIQHAMRMPVACPAVQYFSILSHKKHDLKKKLLKMKCVFRVSLQLLLETFLILRRNERDMIKKCIFVFT